MSKKGYPRSVSSIHGGELLSDRYQMQKSQQINLTPVPRRVVLHGETDEDIN
jgi:hypothetical protein